MPPAGFEPAIPSSERPQAHALDRAATAIGPAESCLTKSALSSLARACGQQSLIDKPHKQFLCSLQACLCFLNTE